jgi:hypothetical protein
MPFSEIVGVERAVEMPSIHVLFQIPTKYRRIFDGYHQRGRLCASPLSTAPPSSFSRALAFNPDTARSQGPWHCPRSVSKRDFLQDPLCCANPYTSWTAAIASYALSPNQCCPVRIPAESQSFHKSSSTLFSNYWWPNGTRFRMLSGETTR